MNACMRFELEAGGPRNFDSPRSTPRMRRGDLQERHRHVNEMRPDS